MDFLALLGTLDIDPRRCHVCESGRKCGLHQKETVKAVNDAPLWAVLAVSRARSGGSK